VKPQAARFTGRLSPRLPTNGIILSRIGPVVPAPTYKFGDFELDSFRFELRCYDRPLKLERIPMELLILLLEENGQVVSRQEIIERLWGKDVFLDTEHGINTAIRKIRAALRENVDRPRFIQTVSGRGYRFLPDAVSTNANGTAASAKVSIPANDVLAPASVEDRPVDRQDPETDTVRSSKQFLERLRTQRILITLGAIFLVLLCIGIWWVSRNTAEANLTPIQIIPLAAAPQGYQRAASFSPDGNQLAFDQTDEQNPGIYVTLTNGEKSLRITSNPGDCCPAWSPDGQRIAFSRYSDRELAIYVISALGGVEHLLHIGSANFPWLHPGFLDWSPDGKFIAFSDRQENEVHASIAMLSVADSTARHLTRPPDQAFDSGPAFSPDGSQVAFLRRSGAGVASDVYVVPASGGEPKRLTFDNAQTDGAPAWTENGREIVFSSTRGGLSTLWRIPASGGQPRAIAGVGAIACCPSISRKRNQLVYKDSIANYGLWRVGLKDQTHVQGVPSLLTSARGLNYRPDFSPDGSKIAFESNRSGYVEIWTCESNGAGCSQLTSLHGVAGTARWSPDGSHIAFEFTHSEHSDIYVVDVAAGRPRLVPTLTGANNLAPSWSRDGEWIYFTSDYKGGRFDLWKVPLKGGSPVRVTNNGGVYGIESVDGHFLYYSKLEAPGVWRRSLNDGQDLHILDKSGGIHWYDWALVRNGIYFLNTAAKPKAAIEFLNFESGKITPVFFPDKPVNWGVIVSPDASYIVYAQNDLFQSSLVLVQNFR